jgi:TIR domain
VKIFVSYTNSDRKWANWIGWHLRDAGHEPFLHEWEVQAGENIARWMEERVQQAEGASLGRNRAARTRTAV